MGENNLKDFKLLSRDKRALAQLKIHLELEPRAEQAWA